MEAEMDNLEAPQWVDFNASVMSDIENFFQTEHETHERRNSPEFFDESTDSRLSVETPRSNYSSPMPRGDSSRSMAKGNFPMPIPKSNSSSPMSKSNFSIPIPKSNFSTPIAKSNFSSSAPKSMSNFSTPLSKKIGNFSSPIPSRISRGSSVKKSGEIFSSAIDSLRSSSEKKIRTRSLAGLEGVEGVAQSAVEASSSRSEKDDCEKSEKNFLYREQGEEETGENNRTLIAEQDEVESRDPIVAAEKNEEFDRAEEKSVVRDGDENLEILKLDYNCEISEGDKSEDKSGDKSEEKSEDKSGDKSEEKSDVKFSEQERSKLDERTLLDCPFSEKKEENLPISRSDGDSKIIAFSENKSEDNISATEKSKLVELVSQLDPPKRLIPEKKCADKISGGEKLKLAKPVFLLGPSKRPISENKSGDKISGEEKLKLAKLVSQLDPPKRPILETKSGDKNSGIEERSNLGKLLSQPIPPKHLVTDKKNPSSRAPAKSRVLTSQVRRYSISKSRRRSNQYVSLAEAVSKFQTGTPKRFRSTNRKDEKVGPVQKTKQTAVKLTCPMSPALLCKFRRRAVSVPNAEEREKLEIEEIRKNRVRPNPIKTSAANIRRTAKGPRTQSDSDAGKNSRALPQATRKIVNAKASTEKRSKVDTEKRPDPAATSSEIKTAMDPPKATTRIGKKPSGLSSSTDHITSLKATPSSHPNVPSQIVAKFPAPNDSIASERKKDAHLMSTSISKHTPRKKMIPSLVTTEDGPVIKNVEILHFGIPINNDYRNKNITRTMPFSFDTRNKESQSKREKLKSQKIDDDKSRKSTFHARPAPAFAKPTSARAPAIAKEKDSNPNKPMLCPLSFQERNELLLQKKKKMIEEIAEREKQARIFHAKPAPAIKPVFVRGASAENLRASSNAEIGKRKSRGLSPAARQRGLSQDSVVSNQENKAPNLPHQQVMQCPKLKNPLMGQNLVIKKTPAGK